MEEFKSIRNWVEDERPREKMREKGPSALTDAELLAILISSGTKGRSALDLARNVLELVNNSLREVGKLSIKELQKIKGIGEARAILLCAAMELGRRRQLSEAPERVAINTSVQAARIIMPHLQDLHHEAFYVLYLNQSSKLLREEIISNGGLTATVA